MNILYLSINTYIYLRIFIKIMNRIKLIIIAVISLFLCANSFTTNAQLGIGLYPTGNAYGMSIRAFQPTKWWAELRTSNFNITGTSSNTIYSIVNEVIAGYHLQHADKYRFCFGVGPRGNFTTKQLPKIGVIASFQTEVFPFAVAPNVALFFDIGFYYVRDSKENVAGGMRVAAGANYYFVKKEKKEAALPK